MDFWRLKYVLFWPQEYIANLHRHSRLFQTVGILTAIYWLCDLIQHHLNKKAWTIPLTAALIFLSGGPTSSDCQTSPNIPLRWTQGQCKKPQCTQKTRRKTAGMPLLKHHTCTYTVEHYGMFGSARSLSSRVTSHLMLISSLHHRVQRTGVDWDEITEITHEVYCTTVVAWQKKCLCMHLTMQKDSC